MSARKIAEKCCASWFAGGSYVHLVEAAVAEGVNEGIAIAIKKVEEWVDEVSAQCIANAIRVAAREIHNESIHKKGTL